MNKEVGYIWQGFFLLLALATGTGMLLSIKPVTEDITELDDKRQGVVERTTAFNQRGQTLFQQNCATCHAVDKDIEGPALATIEDRVKDKALLYAWIRNSPAVLKSGNPYFTKLYEAYNKTPMSVFPNLSDEEIEDILTYIKQKKAAKPSF